VKYPLLLAAIVTTALLTGCGKPETVSTAKIPKEFSEYDVKRVDNYAWLSNPSDSTVIAHLLEENAFTKRALQHTEALQETLYNELVGRIEQEQESLPVKRNGYWYYTRYQKGQQYPLYCRKHASVSAPEEVMLDVPAMAAGHQIFIVREYSVSPDSRWLAYGVDTSGDRRSVLRFKDLRSSVELPDLIPNTSGNYVWGNDNTTLVYVRNDHTVRPFAAMTHTLSSDPAADREIYRESDSTYEVTLSATRDNAYLFLTSGSTLSTECRFLDAKALRRPPVVIQPRQKDLLYSMVDHERDQFYILTNKDAKNFKLVRAPRNAPAAGQWQDVIPHRQDALLEEAIVLSKYFVALLKSNALTQIVVTERSANTSQAVAFDEEAYVADVSLATDAYGLDSIRFSYTSLTTPRSDYAYDLRTQARQLLKREKVGGGYDPSLYETRRLWAPSPDSTRIPISIVYKKALLARDGSNPLLLYAYGSYGISSDPRFSAAVISLLDRGVSFGIAHIRGGQEMGRSWYEDGKVLKKKHTFEDFIACAQFLVNEKYTAPDRLFANGGSAGGMLMGAVTNMRPDLFRGVIAEVPWMDVVTDMLNPDIPLTTLEYDEWGNPGIEKQYRYMLSWSPYDNVRDARYPAILATGGLNDTQVPYFSPAKWVAKVRDHNTGPNAVLFRVNMGAGHGGESGRFERQRLTALKYAFILDCAGIKK